MSGDVEPQRITVREPHWLFLTLWATAFPFVTAGASHYGSRASQLSGVAMVVLLIAAGFASGAIRRANRRKWLVVASVTLLATAVAIGVVYPQVVRHGPPPLVGAAAPDAAFTGSIGVADVSAGDTDYQPDIVASAGDHIAFQIYVRNMSVSARAQPNLSWQAHQMPGGATRFEINLGAKGFVGINDTADITPDAAGQRVALHIIGSDPVRLRAAADNGQFVTTDLAYLKAGDENGGTLTLPILPATSGRDVATVQIWFSVSLGT